MVTSYNLSVADLQRWREALICRGSNSERGHRAHSADSAVPVRGELLTHFVRYAGGLVLESMIKPNLEVSTALTDEFGIWICVRVHPL